jgi:hypothetical protein
MAAHGTRAATRRADEGFGHSIGFVESLARPGRNATGFTNFVPTMAAKWLEVLKEIAPADDVIE